MNKNNLSFGRVFIVTAGALFLWFLIDVRVESDKVTGREFTHAYQVQQSVPNDGEPTEEQKAFVYGTFMPMLERARQSYPIESIRLAFDELMGRLERKEIALQMITTPHLALAGADTSGGQVQIELFVVNLMKLYVMYPTELFEDKIIAALLHEQFHLLKQPAHSTGDPPPWQRVSDESGAWIYSVEHQYLPMIEHGRLRGLDPNDPVFMAIRAYEQANGDPASPDWVEFSRFATGLPPEVFR